MNELLRNPNVNAAVIVAHPDDETLWCGGLIFSHPEWQWTIVTLCRASDPDRAPRFTEALRAMHARGAMADLDDGPEQAPLPTCAVKQAIVHLLPAGMFDLVITHGPNGEYTRHLRHEECCETVVELWKDAKLNAGNLWMFAFEDGARTYFPRPQTDANLIVPLKQDVLRMKKNLLMGIYGFAETSWEVRACPQAEAFFCFNQPEQAVRFINTAKTRP